MNDVEQALANLREEAAQLGAAQAAQQFERRTRVKVLEALGLSLEALGVSEERLKIAIAAHPDGELIHATVDQFAFLALRVFVVGRKLDAALKQRADTLARFRAVAKQAKPAATGKKLEQMIRDIDKRTKPKGR